MSIQLFSHNQTAYDSALAMLESCGKAAIVHPTGTGKSFIAFRLCEEKKDDVICWLSPSEYIFRTQIENLKKAGGEEPENVRFFTYAKLMQMSESELAEIEPSYIVLDVLTLSVCYGKVYCKARLILIWKKKIFPIFSA
jgi:superfamily II DNA or RNA helicase